MRQVVSVELGGGPCRTDCPYYSDEEKVRGERGIPLKTHCRATMQPICVDCDVYNPRTIEKIEVTDAEWKAMLKAIGKKAIKERKPYPEDHEEIHAVGCDWTRRRFRTGASQPCGDQWNAQKSSNIKH